MKRNVFCFLLFTLISLSGNICAQSFIRPIEVDVTNGDFYGEQSVEGWKCIYANSINGGYGVFYRFKLSCPTDIYIRHNLEPTAPITFLYLLDEYGNIITYKELSMSGEGELTINYLSPGTYYVFSESSNYLGTIGTHISAGLFFPNYATIKDIGNKASGFEYTNSHNTISDCSNYYNGQPTNDLMYKFTLTTEMDIEASHVGSGVVDTYIYLLDANENIITSKRSISGWNSRQNNLNTLQVADLPPGTYYVVSEGDMKNGYIATTIKGKPNAMESPSGSDQNYILTTKPTVASSSINLLTEDSSIKTKKIYNGLGYPIQALQIKGNPDKHDLVTYQTYDPFGRESNSWLPINVSGNNGAYVNLTDFTAKAASAYPNEKMPYSKPMYETAVLDRVSQVFGVGQRWHESGKPISMNYLTNKAQGSVPGIADSLVCRQYVTTNSRTNIELKRVMDYYPSTLIVTRVKDEDGNTAYEFKDKLGQLILSRQINDGKFNDTYHVYDFYGNKRAVLPPAVTDKLTDLSIVWSDVKPDIQQLAYLYKYDNLNRCIAKKLPGNGWVYYIYDKADQLILTQDSVQRTKGMWRFTIPDALGRPTLAGTCTNQMNYASNPLGSVVITAAWAGISGIYNGYKIYSFIPAGSKILGVNYYDKYDFQTLSGYSNLGYTAPSSDYGIQYSGIYKGLLTGTFVSETGSGGTALRSAMYYDYRKRLVQTKSTNHIGGTDCDYVGYTFTGKPLKKMHAHTASGKDNQTEYYTYTYDHAERLKEIRHKWNTGSEVVLANHTYDHLGRLSKTVHNGRPDLTENFTYNIRSWVQDINGPQFTENLTYNYNGNIETMQWMQNAQTRKYTFAYDNLSRLKSAAYSGIGYEKYDTSYSYDKHGNMLSLQRHGKTASGTGSTNYGIIDNLAMSYTGNQLTNVAEAGSNVSLTESNDFKKYSTTAPGYSYDGNGSLTKDFNKGISSISYNFLSLPEQMDIKSPVAEARNTYTYSADGKKLKVIQQWNSNFSTTPVIGSTINVAALNNTKTTEYVGNMIYEATGSNPTTLKRILIDGGYIEGGVYYFYFRDHLGNNRAVVSATGGVIQRSHYYPFGMTFAETSMADQDKQPYQYNGKEFDRKQGLNLYDYSARYMEPALGRFTTMDPLAEKYYSISPYAYCGNNPVNAIDPDGRDWFMNQITASVYYNNEMSFGSEGTGAMAGKGWLWMGANEMFMMESGELNNSDRNLVNRYGGTITQYFELYQGTKYSMTMMLDPVSAEMFMNDLGYGKKPLVAKVLVKEESISIGEVNGPVYLSESSEKVEQIYSWTYAKKGSDMDYNVLESRYKGTSTETIFLRNTSTARKEEIRKYRYGGESSKKMDGAIFNSILKLFSDFISILF